MGPSQVEKAEVARSLPRLSGPRAVVLVVLLCFISGTAFYNVYTVHTYWSVTCMPGAEKLWFPFQSR